MKRVSRVSVVFEDKVFEEIVKEAARAERTVAQQLRFYIGVARNRIKKRDEARNAPALLSEGVNGVLDSLIQNAGRAYLTNKNLTAPLDPIDEEQED